MIAPPVEVEQVALCAVVKVPPVGEQVGALAPVAPVIMIGARPTGTTPPVMVCTAPLKSA